MTSHTTFGSQLINVYPVAEIDILVSKLLGFETFANFLGFWFRFQKILSRKKVLVSVSENLVSEKKSRFRFRKKLVSEKSLGFGFGKFGLGRKVSVSVSEKIWSRKKVSVSENLVSGKKKSKQQEQCS